MKRGQSASFGDPMIQMAQERMCELRQDAARGRGLQPQRSGSDVDGSDPGGDERA